MVWKKKKEKKKKWCSKRFYIGAEIELILNVPEYEQTPFRLSSCGIILAVLVSPYTFNVIVEKTTKRSKITVKRAKGIFSSLNSC